MRGGRGEQEGYLLTPLFFFYAHKEDQMSKRNPETMSDDSKAMRLEMALWNIEGRIAKAVHHGGRSDAWIGKAMRIRDKMMQAFRAIPDDDGKPRRLYPEDHGI